MSTAKNTDWLTPDNAALLMVDHQTGISNGVADQSLPEFTNTVMALAKVGQLFKLPTVFTTSADDGPNGPLLSGLTEILPDAPSSGVPAKSMPGATRISSRRSRRPGARN